MKKILIAVLLITALLLTFSCSKKSDSADAWYDDGYELRATSASAENQAPQSSRL